MSILSEGADPARARAIGLFRYLKELSVLRSRTVRSLDAYDSVVWLSDIPREPGCYSASWFAPESDEHADEWLLVGKPGEPVPPPPLPTSLAPWMNEDQVGDSSLEMPELRREIEIEASDEGGDLRAESESVVDTIEAHPEVQALGSAMFKMPGGRGPRRTASERRPSPFTRSSSRSISASSGLASNTKWCSASACLSGGRRAHRS